MMGAQEQLERTSRLPRWLFRGGVAVLWGLCAVLFLEAGARGVLHAQRKDNPFLQAKAAGAPPPLPGRGTPVAPAMPAVPPQSGGAADGGPRLNQPPPEECPPPDWIPAHPPDMGLAARMARAARFAELPGGDRDTFCRLNSEVALVFDRGGNLVGLNGDPLTARLWDAALRMRPGVLALPPRPADLLSYFRALAARAKESPVDAASEGYVAEGTPVPDIAVRLPEDAGAAVLVNQYQPLQPPDEPPPNDTPWDTPYYRYKPNQAKRRGGMPGSDIQTNNFGYRGTDFAVPKPPGVFRVVCVGGSTTEEGGTEESTYPAVLERLLRGRFPDSRIEVFNCGISGMCTQDHLSKLGEYLLFQPDLVILYEGVNDAYMSLPMLWTLVPDRPWAPLLRRSAFVRMAFPERLLPRSAPEDLNRYTVENLRLLGRALRARGAEVAVCGIALPGPDLSPEERVWFDSQAGARPGLEWISLGIMRRINALLNGALRALCAEEGWLFIPVNERLTGGADTFGDLCHLLEDGIRRKAEIVADALASPQPGDAAGVIPGR